MKNCFVFVVCGAKEHIDTLHFSLEYLKKYSQNEIYILTDRSRNEVAIKHDLVLDVKTPENFNPHQASIYLKTGIHKFLPEENSYCYLDSDVIALNPDVDLIFKEFNAPITFAPDHCKVSKFSPFAVFCGCNEKWESRRNTFEKASFKYKINDPKIIEEQKKLLAVFDQLNAAFYTKIITGIQFFFSFNKFHLNDTFYFDKKNKAWKLRKTDEIVLFDLPIKKIEKETGFKYNRWTQKWLDENGNDIWQNECNHLSQFIGEKFKDKVSSDWQHWNGGVFLFNKNSHAFLNAWHHKTMAVFKDEKWRTRDQGTLIATAHEFHLQEHPTLSKKWNFLADYNNENLDFNKEGFFTDDKWKTQQKVNFVHIYHQWGNTDWKLWSWVENKLKE